MKRKITLSLIVSALIFSACQSESEVKVNLNPIDANITFTNTQISGSIEVKKSDYSPDTEDVSIIDASANMCRITDFSGGSVTLTLDNPVANLDFDAKVNNCYTNSLAIKVHREIQSDTGTYESDNFFSILNPEYSQKDVYKTKDTDPVAYYQWYIKNYKQTLNPIAKRKLTLSNDLDVLPVWSEGIKGKDIKVAIVDNGIDMFHPDLEIDTDLSYNYYNNTPNTTPYGYYDGNKAHATIIAGIIGARQNNGIGITGIAPESDIISYNPVNEDLKEMFYSNNEINSSSFDYLLNALIRDLDKIDVYTLSWKNDTTTLSNILNQDSYLQKFDDAVIQAVRNGRLSRGSVILKAVGDDGDNANANFSQIESNSNLIIVGAVNSDDKKPEYATYGSNILVSAYGGDEDIPIVSTDLAGKHRGADNDKNLFNTHLNILGNENYDYTSAYGSDLATAEVSGAVALMLDANPNLTYRDIKIILAKTARQNDPDDEGWKTNGAGYHFNNKYGFGVIDIKKAVDLAKTFVSVGNYDDMLTASSEKEVDENSTDGEITIPLYIDKDINIENVKLYVTLDSDINKVYRYETYYNQGVNENNTTFSLMKGTNILELNTTSPVSVNIYNDLYQVVYSTQVERRTIAEFNIDTDGDYIVEITRNQEDTTEDTNLSDAYWSYMIKTPYPSSNINKIAISLYSPSGTNDLIVNAPNSLSLNDEYNNTRLLSTHFLEENSQGTWYVKFKSTDNSEFEVKKIKLEIEGH